MPPTLVTCFSYAPSWCSWEHIIKNNSPTRLLLTLFLFLFVSSLLNWILLFLRKRQHPRLPPGPPGLPLVGNLLSLEPEFHSYFASLARTYGSIFTIWLGRKPTFVVSSPSIAREILKDHDVVFANRNVSIAGELATYGGRDTVFIPYGSEWRMMKKVLVHNMLSNTTLDAMYSLRRQEIRKTIAYLYSQAGSPLNIGELMFQTTMNVVMNVLWGDVVTGREKASVAAELPPVTGEMIHLMGTPNISDLYQALAWLDLQGIGKKMKGLAKRLDLIFDGIINQQLKVNEQIRAQGDGGKAKKDFLQFLLHLKEEGDPKTPLTMIHVKALLMDMLMGATDTTSHALEFALAEVMTKPKVMQRVKLELDTAVGKNTTLEESHIVKLPYLHAVMKETLRLHPIFPFIFRRSPSETFTIGGYMIPKRARILINVWAMQRDPSVWENPLEFDPERFLNGKWDYSGKEFEYLPFGAGRRNCAGISMAQRMFIFMLGSLLHGFEWKLPEGETMDLSEKFGSMLKKKTPLVVIPTPRLSDPTLYQ